MPRDILEELRRANIERNRIWDPRSELSTLFFATELAGEIGEACNVIKKLERERLGLRGSRATVAELTDELADGIICIDLVAIKYDIVLGRAVVDKHNRSSDKIGLPRFMESYNG